MAESDVVHRGPKDGINFESSWENDYLEAYLISDVGKKRQGNEDSCMLFAPAAEESRKGRGYLIAVADGMGGASAGEHASDLALTTLSEEFYNGTETNIPQHLSDCIATANRKVYEESEADPELQGMGTTLTTMSILGDCAYVGQVGDSRAYLQRKNVDLIQITEDHSLVAEQVRGGIISEEEAKTHSLKNLITRAVGIKAGVEVDLFSVRLHKGDTLLICSDGLCGLVEDSEIGEGMQMESLQSAARLLVGQALEAGGQDNISIAIVRVTGSPPKSEMQTGGEEIIAPTPGFWASLRGLLS